MYHTVNEVAKCHFLDPVSFYQYAYSNMNKYGIYEMRNSKGIVRLEVSTFDVDNLIKDYKKFKQNSKKSLQIQKFNIL